MPSGSLCCEFCLPQASQGYPLYRDNLWFVSAARSPIVPMPILHLPSSTTNAWSMSFNSPWFQILIVLEHSIRLHFNYIKTTVFQLCEELAQPIFSVKHALCLLTGINHQSCFSKDVNLLLRKVGIPSFVIWNIVLMEIKVTKVWELQQYLCLVLVPSLFL